MPNNFTLFVGGAGEDLQRNAKHHDLQAQRIDRKSIYDIKNIKTGYITFGDVDEAQFESLLQYADDIYYVHTHEWRDSEQHLRTLSWVNMFSHTKPVHNLPPPTPHDTLALEDARRGESPQIWAVGCSYTAGHGLRVPLEQRWAALVGGKLNLPVSTLARYGTSVSWAADQILRSDIRPGDIVIWGITGVSRFPFYDDHHVKHVTTNTYDELPEVAHFFKKDVLVTDHMLYTAMTAIEHVIRDAEKVGYQLVITQFPLNIGEHEHIMLEYLSRYDCFVRSYTTYREDWFDSTESGHPGPRQHAAFADKFVDFINQKRKYNEVV